jgi:hypothetical protein
MMMGLPGGACRIHGDVEMGECAGGKQVIKMDPGNSAGYIFAAKIYATAGKCNTRISVKICNSRERKKRVEKQLGCTFVKLNKDQFQTFCSR